MLHQKISEDRPDIQNLQEAPGSLKEDVDQFPTAAGTERASSWPAASKERNSLTESQIKNVQQFDT